MQPIMIAGSKWPEGWQRFCRDRARCKARLRANANSPVYAFKLTSPEQGCPLPSGSFDMEPSCFLTQPALNLLRAVQDVARDLAGQTTIIDAGLNSRRCRKNVEMLFVQLKLILNLASLRPLGLNCEKDDFHLAATSQKPPQDGQADPNAGYPCPGRSRGETIFRSWACTGPYAGCEFFRTIQPIPVIPDDLACSQNKDGSLNAIFSERGKSAG